MKRLALLLVIVAGAVAQTDCARSPAAQARNVILFLGDAGGIPTLHAAGVHAYNEPRRLFIHRMPQIALAETSSASEWVTDSAAAMTALVTGQKTHNGVLSQSAAAVRGTKDGEPLKTLLEYAEERGLSTGVVTNSSVLSATPAACYAHVNDRRHEPAILQQLLKPRFGDGVDVVIGGGRDDVTEAAQQSNFMPKDAFHKAGLEVYESLDRIPSDARRAVVLFDEEFDFDAATQRAIDVLSRNPKGFFLMVESDLHTEELLRGLDRAVELDRAIERTAGRVQGDTLVLFTADHSYDLRMYDGRRGDALLPGLTDREFGNDQDSITLPHVRRYDDHTGEEVIVAALGPGSERVRGVLSNTDVFHIIMAAYGWK